MKNLKKFIFMAIIIAITIIVVIYLNPNKNNNDKLTQKDFKTIDISSGEQVYTYDSYIYIYGKAGIKIIKDQNIILEDNFSLENPYVVTSYDKIAICDNNGKVVRIYSNSGHMYTINTVNNILGFTINKNGFLSIILKNDNNYQIDIYNKDGDNIYSIKDISYDQGVPVGISISQDNKVLAVSYIQTTSATVDSNIVFYSIQDNKLFGGFIKQEQVAGIIKFVDNSNLVCVSDKEIFIIKSNSAQNSEQSKEIYKKPLNNVLNDVKFLDGIGYLVCYGQSILNSEEAMEENTLVFYNQSGGEIGKYYKKGQSITNITANKYGAIVEEGRLFTAINTSGKKIWEYQATQDIKDVIFYENSNKAIIVTNTQIKIVKIDKKLVDKQIDENNTEQNSETSTEQITNNDENNETEQNSETTSINNETTTNEPKTENDEDTTTTNEEQDITGT